MTTCAACRQENPEGFKFCGNCGAPLEARAPAREVRKVVTVLFCDLTGSTALGDHTDPEALRATMRGYYEQMRTILERHGGTVEKFVGDAVMAVFGVPVSHEDDALRAVRAAWEMRAAVPTLGLQARIGVNTGEVVTGEGDTLVTGDAVNVAARLEQAAEAGDLVIGDETRRLVRDAVRVEPIEITAKGKPDPIGAFRVAELDPEASGVARRFDTPLVGRTRELALLTQAYERAVSERSCHLFTLLGPAGVGKSRLVAEFLGGLDATVARGRCLDYGEGITFWPVIEVLKQLRADDTVDAIAEGSVRSNELFLAVRKRLEAVADERPLVVVFDDIHWAEPMLLDLLEHVADLSRGVPLLLLCVARPELLDDRPGWSGGKLNATTALLEPLDADESAALLEGLGAADVADEARTRILESAAGNPLYVEEMLALAIEGGDLGAPSTIHALIQARLDRLGEPERTVIERGAVEGEIFHRASVAQLVNGSHRGIDLELVGLVRKELIRPERTIFPGDDAYRFRHLLIRDAAYDALPKETRAELHLKFADWLREHGELVELDEIVGYHLEQAARYRGELGNADSAIEERASERLAAAGSKALARGDLGAANNLFSRALGLLAPSHARRTPILIELLTVLETHGTIEERTPLIEELEQHDDPVARTHGRLERLLVRIANDPQDVIGETRRVAHEALELFEPAGDEGGVARAWYALFWTDWLRSRGAPALESLERALEHAERAGAHALTAAGTGYLIGPLLNGPVTPAGARARIERLRGRGAFATNSVLRVEARLLQLEGRLDEALEAHERADVLVRDLGMVTMESLTRQWSAEIVAQQGRLDEAIELMRKSADELDELGQTSFRSTALLRIALLKYAVGDVDEAERLAIEGEELGSDEDFVNFALGRGVRAQIAADHRRQDAARQLVESAIEYAYETDFPWVHALVHKAHAHVLAAAGRHAEARAELERAVERFESIGDVFEAGRTRALLVEL